MGLGLFYRTERFRTNDLTRCVLCELTVRMDSTDTRISRFEKFIFNDRTNRETKNKPKFMKGNLTSLSPACASYPLVVKRATLVMDIVELAWPY